MIQDFAPMTGGYVIRGENQIPYIFGSPGIIIQEDGDNNPLDGPMLVLETSENPNYWRNIEVHSFERFESWNDYLDNHQQNEEHRFYIHQGDQNEIDLLWHMFSDIKEYINHQPF